MAKIALGEWAPDSATVDAEGVILAHNVYPAANGYVPVRGPSPVSLALPAECRGAISVKTSTGDTVFFAGTPTKLYKYDVVSTGWTDVSNGGTSYFVPEDEYWSFFPYGQTLIAVHANAAAQKIDINVGLTFADLGGSPPRARFGGVVGEFVVLGGLVDYPNRVAWSALANANSWTPGVDFSDIQDFPDGGDVKAFAGGEFGVVFQESVIRRMVFAPGTPEIFQFALLERGRGAISSWSTLQVGSDIFYISQNGLYQFNINGSVPIGANKVNSWFSDNTDRNYVQRTIATADPTRSRILWAFKSEASADPTILDTILVYDWQIQRWSTIALPLEYMLTGATAAVALDSIAGSIDDMGTLSLDSSIFQGGVPGVAVFTPDHKMNFLEGAALEAQVGTSEAFLARPYRSFVNGVRVDTDAASHAVQVGTRETLDKEEPVRWRPETTPGRRRICSARAKGRYHRARIRIPAATNWDVVSAMEFNPVEAGQ